MLVGALALGSSGYLAACSATDSPRDAPRAATTDKTSATISSGRFDETRDPGAATTTCGWKTEDGEACYVVTFTIDG